MKDLWLSTWKLLHEHPVLWAPFCCAQLAAFVIRKLPILIAKHVMFSPSTHRSVLGFSSSIYADPSEAQRIALRYSIPFATLAHYVNICLLVCALVITANLVRLLLELHAAKIGDALRLLPQSLRRILVFALKFLFGMVFAAMVVMLLAGQSVETIPQRHAATDAFSRVLGLLMTLAIAWVFAPLALNLVRPETPPGASYSSVRLARIFGMAVTAISSIATFAYDAIRLHFQVSSAWQGYAVGAIATLIVNAPLAILFVALALLSLRQAEFPEPALPGTAAAE